MLNKYKKINLENFYFKTDSFWKAPFPSNSRFKTASGSNPKILGGLPTVFGQQELPQKRWWIKKRKQAKRLKLHFFFSSVVFNSIFLFKKFPKNKKTDFGNFKLKKKCY